MGVNNLIVIQNIVLLHNLPKSSKPAIFQLILLYYQGLI